MTIETFVTTAARRFPSGEWRQKIKTARELVAFRMEIPLAKCVSHPEMELPVEVESTLWRDVEAIISGIPMGYLYGSVDFLGLEFLVDSRAMCPRVETEELCDRILRRVMVRHEPRWILDLGCGSGVLGLTLAMRFPASKAVLCDSEQPALDLAKDNRDRLGLADRVSLIRSNWWHQLEVWPDFDLIVSNPPYVADDDQVEPGVLAHEPHTALFSGKDGLDAIKTIVTPLASRIRPGGLAAFELGHNAHDLLSPFLNQLAFPGEWLWETDSFGVRRYLFYVDRRESIGG